MSVQLFSAQNNPEGERYYAFFAHGKVIKIAISKVEL